ncbi:glutamine--tRNA ligase/YqeY domain fusion protein [Deltaproteobacteria bacterium IMCC39524]|nr:glutamine--tRNA ligase/YqeY domain fusion protein [Deltaproteobacteria bacterium IMCC39524]
MSHPPVQLGPNFIRNIVDEDLASGKHKSVVTRFPPEPNGYLHIGHAKSICLNFGLAALYQGRCHLRFDDTNPVKEEQEYIDAIKTDVSWLGFDWGENEYHASDYFEALYAFAEKLVEKGLAFVCDLPPEEMREYRGTLTEPGKESPYRSRTVGENLDLLRRMRAGEFDDGSRVLRAKIDMAAPNMNLRDPVLYRILRATHPRTGDAWCIYPMYDFAHGQSDSLEKITHSLCTLEFQDHRPLYDWLCEALEIYHPQQIEFARLNLTYTVMSKRRLLALVNEKHVSGWDDPRMPTLSGMRRRGFTAAAIRTFCERIGVGKSDSVIDMSTLEDCVREDLDQIAPRAMGVLRPLKVTITNYPEGQSEEFTAPKHPKKPEMGSRTIPFGREIYVDRDDFMEDPPKKFFRLGPDREVRLRYGYIIRCDEVIKDPVSGEVTELRCSYDAETGGGVLPEGRKKVKGIIHWVAAAHAVPVEVRLYDRLLSVADPASEKDRDYRELLNPESLEVLTGALVEPGLASAEAGETFQFERLGYFCVDGKGSQSDKLAFNRTVTLRDTWAKLAKG